MSETNGSGFARRGFIGALAGVSAAVAMADGTASPAAAQESADERKKPRYQETPHVLKFYETNRY